MTLYRLHIIYITIAMNKFKYAANKCDGKTVKCISIPVDMYKSEVVILMPDEAGIRGVATGR